MVPSEVLGRDGDSVPQASSQFMLVPLRKNHP